MLARTLSLLLLLAVSAAAQTLPDAPTPQPPAPAHGWVLWDGRDSLSNVDVLKSKRWWIPTVALLGASVWDVETTHAGLAHHMCVEGNHIYPPHPSRGELYREAAIENAAIIGLGFLFTKARAPHWIY